MTDSGSSPERVVSKGFRFRELLWGMGIGAGTMIALYIMFPEFFGGGFDDEGNVVRGVFQDPDDAYVIQTLDDMARRELGIE